METFWLSLFSGGVALGAFGIICLVLAASLWIAILIHELGHALVAWICRFTIFEFRVGSGRPAFPIRRGRCQLHFAPWPSGGLIRYFPLQARRLYRLRALAALAGGPMANATTFAFGFWIIGNLAHPPTSGTQALKFILEAITYLSAWMAISSLFPRSSTLFGGKYDSDGLQLLKLIFRKPDPTLATHSFCLFHGWRLFEAGETKRAARWIRRALRHAILRSEHGAVLACASIVSEAGHADEAHKLLRGILDAPGLDALSPLRRDAADHLGSLAIYHHRPDFLPEVTQVLRQAVEDFPSVITLRGTLGGVLFESGEIAEAEVMLAEVFTTSTAGIDRSISAAYLACISRGRGDLTKAQWYTEKALQEIPPSGRARHLVERLTQQAALRDTPEPIPA